MRRISLVLLTIALACGRSAESPEGGDGSAEDSGAATADSASATQVVVLRSGPLHLEPDGDSPGIADVPAGMLLRTVAGSASPGWVRVATWDDRRGWLPEDRLIPQELWAHYGRALGGISPVLLRPAYPVEGGRWIVEAPVGSPGFTPASSAWLLGDAAEVRVVAIDSVENVCGGERYRVGVFEAVVPDPGRPLLERGRIAAPSGDRPTAQALPIGPLVPDPTLVGLAEETARELGGAPAASTAWVALGPDVAWAALSWPERDEALGISQRAAAIVFRRSAEGWDRAASIAPTPSTAEIPTPAWKPVAAWSTDGPAHPTILLLETMEYEGAHLDVWLERGDGYRRLYDGYYWGC